MKLQAQIGDDKHEVEIKRDGDRVVAEIDGRKYEIEASEPEPNVFLLKNDGKIFQAFVSPRSSQPMAVRVGTDEIDITLIDPKRLRASAGAGEHAGGLAEIKTAMPGKVVRILISQGDAVEKGDGIIVVEAMKMQNEMRSPKDGKVSEIRVAEGETVGAGDVLVVIE